MAAAEVQDGTKSDMEAVEAGVLVKRPRQQEEDEEEGRESEIPRQQVRSSTRQNEARFSMRGKV